MAGKMADRRTDLFRCSTIKIPTVIGLLKDVLAQYPDNGQILKELVQNAEDAEATTFEVLHDSRSYTSTSEILGKFTEGPALCVYNDAVFTEKDWDGIRMLSDSVKRNDPLKVGQFGLGFKSIFHFTDYVTIISGNNVLFMDPSEAEDEMCRELPLTRLPEFLSVDECLYFWGQYLKRDCIHSGHFPGTLFWFPLRKQPSKLSSTVYQQTNVDNLFKSFGVEASLCLTFLKSLESICIKKVSGNNVPVDILRVNISSSSWRDTQLRRRKFRKQLQQCNGFSSDPVVSKYEITVKLCGKDIPECQQQYKVLHYLQAASKPEKDGQISHMPLVGIAAPVPPVNNNCQGHIFCFLPLPLDSANNTNLPVQINGYFVLDQNRRHVKWRTQESRSEPNVNWNEDLVENVVADAYLLFLKYELKLATDGDSPKDVWYSLLPHIASTSGRWNLLARKIWKQLIQLPILHSDIRNQMMLPKDVINSSNLNGLNHNSTSRTIQKVSADLKLPLVAMPEHVVSALHETGAEPKAVTPELIKSCLKNSIIKDDWNKLHLLEYVISDAQYQNLEGLPLLPVKNGNWIAFRNYGDTVFICSSEEQKALLGVESQLLRDDLPAGILQHFQTMSSRNVCQLRIFSASPNVIEMLPKCVKFVQSTPLTHQQLEPWLRKVWDLLQSVNLQKVESLAVLPSESRLSPSSFISLSSAFVVQEYQMSRATVEVLKLLEIKVLPTLPNYIRHWELHRYLNKPDGEGIQQALQRVLFHQSMDSLANRFNSYRSNEGRLEFCSILCEAKNIKPDVLRFLRKLHLFKAVHGYNVTDVNIDAVNKIFPQITDFPVGSPEQLIQPCNSSIQQLAQKLGAVLLNKVDLCLLALQNRYSGNDAIKLGWYVLQDKACSSNRHIHVLLTRLKFIPTTAGKMCMASDLYDPEDLDADALLGEDLIPHEKYWNYLNNLRSLGLKKVNDMPKEELVGIVKDAQNKNLDKISLSKKVNALLRVINCRSDCLTLCQEIANVRWVCGSSGKPANYPRGLFWATNDELYAPSTVKSFQHFKYMIGSCVPLTDTENIPNVAQAFGWNSNPNIDEVIIHMKNVITACSSSNGVPESAYYEHMKKIYKHLMMRSAESSFPGHLESLARLPFIITGIGFKLPCEVYIPSRKGDLALDPYMYSLPPELGEYSVLFQSLGTYENQTPQLYLKILKQIHKQHSSQLNADVENDLRIVISVLQKLQDFVSEIDCAQLLLPVESSTDRLELVELNRCTYSDQNCEWLQDEDLDVRFIHSSISNSLAIRLGVKPLNMHLLADEEAVMEWGQQEPLTTRLHNLLQEYRDGVAVLKELVQNADDAGASVVSLLYDERNHVDSCKRLITEQYKECQGPALWAYNDAVFTEVDFKNLRKLGEGTKKSESMKIGKFGLGFCSVYNLTDVPSFVSGSNYVIFDPHQKYLENKRYGVRYNFSKKMNQILLKNLSGQFQPFYNIFECQLQDNETFDGTLFRFPMRTSEQANTSKISGVSYGHKEVMELLNMFRGIVGEILLYTQNVKEVNVFHLGKASLPEDMKLLYKSSREIKKSVKLSDEMLVTTNSKCNQLKNVAQLVNNKWNGQIYQESVVSDINIVNTPESAQLFQSKPGVWTVSWLTSWHSGTGEAFRYAESLGGNIMPLGAVSLPIERKKDCMTPRKLKNLPYGFYKEGHMHCFLPLPVKTPLPVQINGFFEVASDRTSLKSWNVDDRMRGKDWNSVLMEDTVASAYLGLIHTLRIEGLCHESLYFSIWPQLPLTDEMLVKLVQCFYGEIKRNDLRVFHNDKGWHSFSEICFLSDYMYNAPDIGQIAFEFLSELLADTLHLVHLPEKFVHAFGPDARNSIINEECFYMKYLIPNLSLKITDDEKRNKLVVHALDEQKPFFMSLKDSPCIPTLPNGSLKKPRDLIDPKSKIGRLFNSEDERFPLPEFLEGNRREVLIKLGMRSCLLDVDMVNERASTVNNMSCLDCAVTRSSLLLSYIETDTRQMVDICKDIKDIPFIPVMPRPEGWCAKWGGENSPWKISTPCSAHAENCIMSLSFAPPTLVHSPELMELCGSTCIIHGCIETNKYLTMNSVWSRLGMITQQDQIPLECVIDQLTEYCTNHAGMSKEELEYMCFKIYKCLNDSIKQSSTDSIKQSSTDSIKQSSTDSIKQSSTDLSSLSNVKVLFTRYGLVEPSVFSIDENIDCAPALYSVRREGLMHYESFIKSLGIKEHFHPETVLQILLQKKTEFLESTVPEEEVKLFSNLLNLLFGLMSRTHDTVSIEDLYLPNAEGILCSVNNLCIDDGANFGEKMFNFLHPEISFTQEMLRWLGIVKKKRKRFREASHRLKFGQKEPLATRLKNILKDYPCDSGIMKELLQNADDAGATEIAFIKDFRTHNNDKLFDEMWAPLQGPALCVYNNSCFTSEDLEGIQNLGDSSKIQDPTSTGQYGIGFNAVYHLTDAPSFLTRGKDVPDNETLCLFDPLCIYDPDSCAVSPGVQLTDLDNLRIECPDSFLGYLEETGIMKETGTMFRLPLRTNEDSKIGNTMSVWKLKELLEEFKSEMKIYLLFLKSVRKISLCSIGENGEIVTEYYVRSEILEEEKVSKLKDVVRNRKLQSECLDTRYFHKMERIAYNVTISDKDGGTYLWLLIQQIGSDPCGALPDLIVKAFKENCLRLLPQAGVAVLLKASQPMNEELFKVFCFLPLPIQSGLRFCVNGHFALDSSRRNLWTGTVDFKAEWNNWLMEKVLAPVAVTAINEYRKLTFKGRNTFVTEQYSKEVRLYYDILPDIDKASAGQWKQYIKWFYQCMKIQEVPMCDVFIPENDALEGKENTYIKGITSIYCYTPATQKSKDAKPIQGKLIWHSLKTTGSEFPVYFCKGSESDSLLNTFKRLGMKIGSMKVYLLLHKAEMEPELLDSEKVLEFLLSWNTNFVDKCQPALGSHIKYTPFLCVENVCSLMSYISSAEKYETRLNHLPLLVTRNEILGSFEEENPIFCTMYGHLLPDFKEEFLHEKLIGECKKLLLKKEVCVIKPFSLEDFACRLSKTLDESYKSQMVRLQPEKGKESRRLKWIREVWNFIIGQLKLKFKVEKKNSVNTPDYDWPSAKNYISEVLGDWALYPIKILKDDYATRIKNACMTLEGIHIELGVFALLPLPRCHAGIYIPSNLGLATSLKNPVAMLDILDKNQQELVYFTTQQPSLDLTEVLEYFGTHCEDQSLCREKLAALPFYVDADGCKRKLERQFIIFSFTQVLLKSIKLICERIDIVLLKPPSSDKVDLLYKYLDPNCVMSDLSIFSRVILPNFAALPESEHIILLSFLRDELNKTLNKSQESWREEEKVVISKLQKTPFIMQNGQLWKASDFYDPDNEVFSLMEEIALPDEWCSDEWKYFLTLAGIIKELTGEMFIQYAQSMHNRAKDVPIKQKSKVLVRYLKNNYDSLNPHLYKIREIEFLVPKKKDELQNISPYFVTESGLISFSSSAPCKFENLLWTTVSILPKYADLAWREAFGGYRVVPENEFYLHICNITSKANPKSEHLEAIMNSVYGHLETITEPDYLKRFARENIPLIHMIDKEEFVTVDIVVREIAQEIEPYLYKAPVRYGRFFSVFEMLGVSQKANCDHYIQVLNEIHKNCQGNAPNPEESRCMKLAIAGLLENISLFTEITAKVLYLPTKDNRLVESTSMYVSDNTEFEKVSFGNLDKPIFIGLFALGIDKTDRGFVTNLPDRLKPKFLSEVVVETFEDNASYEVGSSVHKITEFIYSRDFQQGIIRIMNHYQANSGNCLSNDEILEVEKKLKTVIIKVMNEISVTLEVNGQKIGTMSKMYHVKKELSENSERVILYLNASVEDSYIPQGLYDTYKVIFDIPPPDMVANLMFLFSCIDKPVKIEEYLNKIKIKPFGETVDEIKFFQTDVGRYLDKAFIPFLDNEFCRFHEKEFVAMKKYIQEEIHSEADFLYIIVQVKCKLRSTDNVMFDEYEVNTGEKENPNIVVKAHQLYKFVRMTQKHLDPCKINANAGNLVMVPPGDVNKEKDEELSKEQIMKLIRKQMKEIWQENAPGTRRHLVHRLILKWHPDKNLDKAELCTRVIQYIQSLLSRLEMGETIPDDDDDPTYSQGVPSDFYSDAFRPPPKPNTGFKKSRENTMSDYPEAERWWKQAQHDMNEAFIQCGRSSCWTVYMCYKAVEKALKAVLYLNDCKMAQELHLGPQSHDISFISGKITSEDLSTLVKEIVYHAGLYSDMQYPSNLGVPCDYYTEESASLMLQKTKTLMQKIQQRF